LQDLDAEEVEKAFRAHATTVEGEPASLSGIALDAKTVRGSLDHFEDRKAAQALSAWAMC
jgi:hypothetical protein